MIRPLLGLSLTIALAVTRPSLAASLDVTVTNLRNNHGHVFVAVCGRATFLGETCPYAGSVKAGGNQVTVHIDGIPPGTYAVQAFQDERDTGEIDRNVLGIPREGIGFSRDAPFRFGPPAFDDAAIAIGVEGTAIQLALRYF